jgi:nitrogenase molybdenum-iron protein alpha/beta subunit
MNPASRPHSGEGIMRELRRILPPPMTDFTAIYSTLSQMEGCFTLVNAPQGCTQVLAYDFAAFGMDDSRLGNVDIENLSLTFGAEDKVKRAVLEVDEIFSPAHIALVAAPVSALIGVDLEGVARDLAGDVRARLLPFPSGRMEGLASAGEEELFTMLAREVAGGTGERGGHVNLIGMGMQEYNRRSDLREVERLVVALGASVGERFSLGGDLRTIAGRAGDASLNLVLSESGIEAARILQDRFGTPFVTGLPFGFQGTRRWLEEVGAVLGADPANLISKERRRFEHAVETILHAANDPLSNRVETLSAALAGPGLYTFQLADFLAGEVGLDVGTVALYTHAGAGVLPQCHAVDPASVLIDPGEEELESRLAARPPGIVFGDTYFHRLAGEEKPFLPTANPYLLAGGFYDDAPYVGFRGTLYLLESLTHRINMNREFVFFHLRG